MAVEKAVNKVIYGNRTLIDISDTTATAQTILTGYTAYGADGNKITGAADQYVGLIYQDEDGYLVLSEGTHSGLVSLQSKSVTPTEQTQVITADSGFTGIYSVTVNPIPSQYVIPTTYPDGDQLSYGDVTKNIINVGQIDYMIVGADDKYSPVVDIGQSGYAKL